MDSDRWRLTKERLFQFTMSDEEFDNSYIEQLASCLKDDLEALEFLLEGSFAKRVPVLLALTDFMH